MCHVGNTVTEFGLIALMLLYSKTLNSHATEKLVAQRLFPQTSREKEPENMLFSSVCFDNEFFSPWTNFPKLSHSFPTRNHSTNMRKPGELTWAILTLF